MADQGGFASMFESGPSEGGGRRTVHLEAGQQIEGTVLAISGGLVILDIGSSADATLDYNEVAGRTINVGDKLKATVKNPRKDGPELTISLGRGGGAVNSASLQLALEGGTPVSGTVTASNKGGYTVEIAGIRAFCPISQIDSSYVNDPEAFVGQTLEFLITEIREGGRNVVVSRKKLLADARRGAEDEMASQLVPGALVSGTIKSTVRQGAIVDLGGLEGFIPISELSRGRVENPEDIVTVGEAVKVQVLSVERREKGLSIRLSLKALEGPSAKEPAPEVDEILSGKVVKHVPNGLIVATGKGEGLIPTRELQLAPGADHRRTYPVDTELRVVVVARDGQSGKLRFSVSKVAQVEERNNYREFSQGKREDHKGPVPTSSMGSLGALMAKQFPEAAAQAEAAARVRAAEQAKLAAQAKAAPSASTSTNAPAVARAQAPQKSGPAKDHSGIKRRPH